MRSEPFFHVTFAIVAVIPLSARHLSENQTRKTHAIGDDREEAGRRSGDVFLTRQEYSRDDRGSNYESRGNRSFVPCSSSRTSFDAMLPMISTIP